MSETKKFKVVPTMEMGSYSGVCSDSYSETFEENALWDYNSARAHDGLPPIDIDEFEDIVEFI